MVCGSGNQIAKMRTERKKDHQPETADGLAYLWCIVGNCLTLFPTFLRSCENTMSATGLGRSEKVQEKCAVTD